MGSEISVMASCMAMPKEIRECNMSSLDSVGNTRKKWVYRSLTLSTVLRAFRKSLLHISAMSALLSPDIVVIKVCV